jgi:hypothetical protein
MQLHGAGASGQQSHQRFDISFAMQPHAAPVVLHSEGSRADPEFDAAGVALLMLMDGIRQQRSREKSEWGHAQSYPRPARPSLLATHSGRCDAYAANSILTQVPLLLDLENCSSAFVPIGAGILEVHHRPVAPGSIRFPQQLGSRHANGCLVFVDRPAIVKRRETSARISCAELQFA